MFKAYLDHGWKLCRIESGSKGPRSNGWNKRENALASADGLVGAGLLHAYSSTCAFDIDRLDDATKYLQDRGIDISDLLIAQDSVQISSERPNRAKLLYALTDPLPSKTFAGGAFELRCATNNGLSVQDVLPPSIHPDTGKPYKWAGDWRQLPTLPPVLRDLWLAEIHTVSSYKMPESAGLQTAELKSLLGKKSPDCGYDEWVRLGMALHHEFNGSDEGFALWDTWSAPSGKYPGIGSLQSHWLSFGRSLTPITLDSIFRVKSAEVQDFDVVSEAPAKEEKNQHFVFLSLLELCARPEPDWIIKGVLPDTGLGSFWGQPSGGKTFLAVDIALCVALGQKWQGRDVKQGSALYIAAEDDSGVQVRFASGLASRGVQDAPIRVLPCAPVFTNPKQTAALLEAIASHGPQSLVFVDTLAAVTPGSDENAAKDMSQVIHFCQEIHKVTGGLVLLIHHDGKTPGRGPRGWSGLHGAFDVEWEVTSEEGKREMTISKMKNAAAGGSYEFRLSPLGESCVVEWT